MKKNTELNLRTAAIVVALALAVTISSLIYLGPVPDAVSGHDLLLHMDAAWKIFQGHIPRVDFSHPGFEAYHVTIAAMITWFGPSLSAITLAHLLFLSLFPWIALCFASHRFDARWTLAISLLFVALMSGVAPLGLVFENVSHSGYADRIGWGALTLVMLYALFRTQKTSVITRWVEPLLAGVLLGFLFLMKTSYFLMAGGAIGVGFALRTLSLRQAAPLGVGLVLIALRYSWSIDWRWGAYLKNYALAAQMPQFTLPTTLQKLFAGFPLAVGAGLLFTFRKELGLRKPEVREFFALYVFVLLVGIGILMTNVSQPGDAVVYLLIPLLGVVYLKRLPMAANYAAMAMICGFWVTNSVLSISRAYWITEVLPESSPAANIFLAAPPFRTWMSLNGGGSCNPTLWLVRMNQGLAMVDKYTASTTKVATLDYANLFPFAMGRPSPKHGSLSLQYGVNVDDKYFPDPAEQLRDADVVMVPNGCPENEAALVLKEKYREYLTAHFPQQVQSEHWLLYAKELSPDRPRSSSTPPRTRLPASDR